MAVLFFIYNQQFKTQRPAVSIIALSYFVAIIKCANLLITGIITAGQCCYS